MEVNKMKKEEERKDEKEENDRKKEKENMENMEVSENICDLYYQIKIWMIHLCEVERIMNIDFKETVRENKLKIQEFNHIVMEIRKIILIY